jgi:hypothetical protein
MADISLRIARGAMEGKYKGEGDTFIVPIDLIPKDLDSGESIKFIIEGVINVNSDTATIDARRVYIEKLRRSRPDVMQEEVDKELEEMIAQSRASDKPTNPEGSREE